jgi:hypothetical protein
LPPEVEGLYKMSMADNLLSDNERAQLEAKAAAMEAEVAPIIAAAEAALKEAEGRRTDAEAGLARMQMMRERIAAMSDRETQENVNAESRGNQSKLAAETLLKMAQAHREREGAKSDRIKASQKPAKAGA